MDASHRGRLIYKVSIHMYCLDRSLLFFVKQPIRNCRLLSLMLHLQLADLVERDKEKMEALEKRRIMGNLSSNPFSTCFVASILFITTPGGYKIHEKTVPAGQFNSY